VSLSTAIVVIRAASLVLPRYPRCTRCQSPAAVAALRRVHLSVVRAPQPHLRCAGCWAAGVPAAMKHIPILGSLIRGVSVKAVQRILEDIQAAVKKVRLHGAAATAAPPHLCRSRHRLLHAAVERRAGVEVACDVMVDTVSILGMVAASITVAAALRAAAGLLLLLLLLVLRLACCCRWCCCWLAAARLSLTRCLLAAQLSDGMPMEELLTPPGKEKKKAPVGSFAIEASDSDEDEEWEDAVTAPEGGPVQASPPGGEGGDCGARVVQVHLEVTDGSSVAVKLTPAAAAARQPAP
jgi:hypothetical protein